MNMRLFRVLFGFFWFVGGVGNPLFSSERISCEPLEEEASWSVCLQDGLDSLLQDELLLTSQLGLCVYDLTDDTLLYAYQAKQRMRPASTEKLVTAVTALSELGSDYRFATRLFYTGEIRGRVLYGDLYAVGGFDPCFGKEDLLSFGKALKESDVDSITGRLYADVSMKDTLQWGWGWCWDDDMPVLTPLLYGKKNIFIEAFSEVLHGLGIRHVFGGQARCPQNGVLLAGRTRQLADVLHPMMKESDNLCAEALFYQLAARTGKPYASRKEAMYYIERLIGRLGYDPGKYIVADGSGVSLYNYLTPELEIAFLRYAYRDEAVFSPLYISLKTAIITIVITFFLGLFLAKWTLNRKHDLTKIILDGIFTMPLVLPPTVMGFFLLMIFGVNQPIGKLFLHVFHYKITFSFSATVIAAVVISFPLMYRSAKAAMEQIDHDLIDSGRTLGMSEKRIFFTVILPEAMPGIISGGVLSFARGLGEFGATAMLAGNIVGKTRTLPLAVYSEVMSGNYDNAGVYVFIIVVVCLIAVVGVNVYQYSIKKKRSF